MYIRIRNVQSVILNRGIVMVQIIGRNRTTNSVTVERLIEITIGVASRQKPLYT